VGGYHSSILGLRETRARSQREEYWYVFGHFLAIRALTDVDTQATMSAFSLQ